MSANKRIAIAAVFSVFILAFQFVDVFFIKFDLPFFSGNILARVFGIVILLSVSGVVGFSLKKFCFKSYGWYFEILYGFIFSVVPIFIVYLFKYVYFLFRGYENLTLTFRPSGFDSYDGSNEYLINILVYVVTLLIVAVFKEIFYRGFLISQFSEKLGVPMSVFIQSIIYMLSFVPTIAFYWYTGRFEFQGPLMSFFLICGHLTYNLLCGVKWGMYYRVNGTVWMSITDHFLVNFIVSSFFFTESRLPEKFYIIEVIVIQLISVCMFIPFFLKRDRQNELAAAEYALSRESLKMGIDNYSPSIIRKYFDKTNSHKNDAKKFKEEFVSYEELVSLDVIEKPNEESLLMSVRGGTIDDTYFEYNNSADSFDASPSETAQEYFDDMFGVVDNNGNRNDKDKDAPTENAENISKLVKAFFDDSFDKHTF